MKKKLLIGVLIFLTGFIALFFVRLSTKNYSYSSISNFDVRQGIKGVYEQSSILSENNIKNYATAQQKYKSKNNSKVIAIDQKYEKIAAMQSQTYNFDDDEKLLRTTIDQLQALIQYEQKSGNRGHRNINMSIGVNPIHFDTMVNKIKKVGYLESIQINKTDKTNEYKELTAKRTALDKTRASLISLKSAGGSITELITLENRILEIENEIQSYGINLGDYDSENEFCTIVYTLHETYKPIPIKLINRLLMTFEWTLSKYAIFTIILLVVIGISYIGILIIEKIIEHLKPMPPNKK